MVLVDPWREAAMSRHGNFITADEKARRVFEIQAHVFRFNGTLAKGAEHPTIPVKIRLEDVLLFHGDYLGTDAKNTSILSRKLAFAIKMKPSPKTAYLLLTGYGLLSNASPIEGEARVEERQSCPSIHIFGARETTASPGYGSSASVVNAILSAYPGSTAEAISYPACGGQASCGGASYSSSVQQGIAAAASAVNSFYTRCPNTQIVLAGYSQGAEIFDVAFCGGGDPNQGYTNTAVQFSAGAVGQVKAAILMGAPTYQYGLSYGVGTCRAGGFDARPASFQCPSAAKVQSYCDGPDPYCCNGNDAATHNGYGSVYGSQALTFVKSKLSSSGGGSSGSTTSAAGSTPTAPGGGTNCASLYGQCGGQGWTGATCCSSGSCKAANSYYSQCL